MMVFMLQPPRPLQNSSFYDKDYANYILEQVPCGKSVVFSGYSGFLH